MTENTCKNCEHFKRYKLSQLGDCDMITTIDEYDVNVPEHAQNNIVHIKKSGSFLSWHGSQALVGEGFGCRLFVEKKEVKT